MKKFLAILLCLVMVFSLSANAFAEHSHTITIENTNDGYVYKAYQIFDGDLTKEGVLSNVAWGSGIDGAGLLADLKANIASYAGCNDAAGVAATLAGLTSKNIDDPAAMEFADIASKYIIADKGVESVPGVSSEGNKIYTISGLEDGYYIVKNETIPVAEDTTYSRYILEVVRDITVAHKGDFPKVEKKIVEGESRVDVNEAGVGEVVNYEIIGTIPASIDSYITYYYAFNDTLSKGLTYNNDIKIFIDNGDGSPVNVTEYFFVEAVNYVESGASDPYKGGTAIYAGIQDILALERIYNGTSVVEKIDHGTKVILTYSATVNEEAVIAVAGNPNKVRLEYDNNPNTEEVPQLPPPTPGRPDPTDPPSVTPEDEVETYITKLRLFKKDGQGNPLKGAEFTLKGETVKKIIVTKKTFAPAAGSETPVYWELKDGTFTDTAPVYDDPATDGVNEDTSHAYQNLDPTHVIKEVEEIITKTETVDVKSYVGEDGYVTFTGLSAGDYVLTETVTPSGFNTINPIDFTIEFDTVTKKFSISGEDRNLIAVLGDNTLYAEIINVAGSTLPSTGGIGTTIFYIVGGILVAGSLIFLVTKKRMS